MSGVGDCFRDPSQARRANTTATRLLAELAERHPARFVYISTDLVFNGHKQWYRETDCPEPLSVYGQTKAEAERAVLHHRLHLVLRLSLLFGPSLNGRPSFFQQQINAIRDGLACQLFEDEWRAPLSLPVAAQGILMAAASEVGGILHLAGPQRLSRLEMGQRLARVLGKSPQLCKPTRREDITAAEPRPRDTSLNCELWERTFPDLTRPDYESSLQDMLLG
jgi:dTDP-4-dehydrorhamnose reductase